MNTIFNKEEKLLSPKNKTSSDDIIMSLGWLANYLDLNKLACVYFDTAQELNTLELYKINGEKYCYPIFFAYRQYLELILKDLCIKYYIMWCYKYYSLKGIPNLIKLFIEGKNSDIIKQHFKTIASTIKHPNKKFKLLNDSFKNYNRNQINNLLPILISNEKYKNLFFIKELFSSLNSPNDSHNLERYVTILELYMKQENDNLKVKQGDFNILKCLLLEFNKMDNMSFSFRYPFAKDGEKTAIQKYLETKKVKIKTIFGEDNEVNLYSNIDFVHLNEIFNKIFYCFELLGSEYKEFNEFYSDIVEIQNGHYFSCLYEPNTLLSKYNLEKTLPVIEKALKSRKYLKPEFITILKKYKTDIKSLCKLFNKFEESNFQESKALFFVKNDRFPSDYLGSGGKIAKIRTSLNNSRKDLKRISKKYFLN